jgi:general secretion pathway protein G
MHRKQAGFTLIEIMIVVMIVGLLMTAIATQLIGRAQQAQVDLTHTQLRQVEQALELYKLDNGRYPTAEQGLIALVRQPTSGPPPRRYPPGGYLRREVVKDPWGAPLLYQLPGTHNAASFDLYSFGPDGAEGGEGENADIVNWNTETFE